MPDGVELVPHDLIERLEQPILHREILHVDLVGLPHLLETRVHDLQNGLLDPHHGPRHRNPNVDNHGRVPLELVGHVDVEPGPDVELFDVEALHGALGLGEGGDHGVGAVGEGEDGEGAVEEEANGEGVGGGLGEGMGGGDDEGGHEGGGEAAGEEVDGEDAGGDEEGGVGSVKGESVLGGKVGG